jgi:toxin YoeB
VRLVFTTQGWEDYCHWQQTDRSILKRINRLLDDALRNPTAGIGKPEVLKYGIVDAWSRRITDERRLVYRVLNDDLVILQAHYHYTK